MKRIVREEYIACLEIYSQVCSAERAEDRVREVLLRLRASSSHFETVRYIDYNFDNFLPRNGVNVEGQVIKLDVFADPSRGFWDLPGEISSLKYLQELHVGERCKSIPATISNMESLVQLYMRFLITDRRPSCPDFKIRVNNDGVNFPNGGERSADGVVFHNIKTLLFSAYERRATRGIPTVKYHYPSLGSMSWIVVNQFPSLRSLSFEGINGRILIDSIINDLVLTNRIEAPIDAIVGDIGSSVEDNGSSVSVESANEAKDQVEGSHRNKSVVRKRDISGNPKAADVTQSATIENEESVDMEYKDTQVCRNLVHLELWSCSITEVDLEKLLFDVLPRYGTIHILSLFDNDIKSLKAIGKRTSSWWTKERKDWIKRGQEQDYFHCLDIMDLTCNPVIKTIYGSRPMQHCGVVNSLDHKPKVIHGPMIDPSFYEQRSDETASLVWILKAFSVVSISGIDYDTFHSKYDNFLSKHPGEVEKWLRLNIAKRQLITQQQNNVPLYETLARLYDESDVVVPRDCKKKPNRPRFEHPTIRESYRLIKKDKWGGKDATALYHFIRSNHQQIFSVDHNN